MPITPCKKCILRCGRFGCTHEKKDRPMSKELRLTLDPEAAARLRRLTQNLPRPPRTTTRTVTLALHLLERVLEVADDGTFVVVVDGVEKEWVVG